MQARSAIDSNDDGVISAEEARAHRERAFSALDANSDRKLSRQETAGLSAIEPGYVVITRMIPVVVTADVGGQMWSQMDQNQDQQISRQEYMQHGPGLSGRAPSGPYDGRCNRPDAETFTATDFMPYLADWTQFLI
jgi:EF hand